MNSKTILLATAVTLIASASFAISPPRSSNASGNAATVSASVSGDTVTGTVTTNPGNSNGQSQTHTASIPTPPPLQ